MEKMKVKDSHLIRDKHSKAILSTDLKAKQKYEDEKKRKTEEQRKLNEIDTMKEEIAEIKHMLTLLLEQRKND